VLQARALIESADANIATAEAAVTVATAGVGAAEASLESAKINLDYTEVRAPIGGRVSRRFVDRGNLISGGTADSTLLTTIVSLDPIHVSFDADEAAFLKYERLKAEGKRASSRDVKNPIYLALADERPAFPHQGHMDFVDNRMDPNTGTMRGRAILRNPEFVLTPGLFARLRLPGSGAYEAVLIPDAAIVSDQSERFVYVVEADGAIRRQVVDMGPVVQGLRVVRKGLSGAEMIIVRGLQRVRPGLKAKATVEKLDLKNDEGLPDQYEPVPQEDWIPREISYLPSAPARRTARTVSLMQTTASP
jgi:RND family efflux transporter MFP subunit